MSNVVYLASVGRDSSGADPFWGRALGDIRNSAGRLSTQAAELINCLNKLDALIEMIEDPALRKTLQEQADKDRLALNAAVGELLGQVDKLDAAKH